MHRRETGQQWAVAIFACNEQETIAACIASLERAANAGTIFTVILNGTKDASLSSIESFRHLPIRVYAIEQADKANAINTYLHQLRPLADCYFMVDAYVRVEPDALACLASALDRDPSVHIASAVPTTGRSAQAFARMLVGSGGVNGNLYVMRRAFVDRLVAAGFRIPLGLYRTDSLLGSMAAHDLDPLSVPWDRNRVPAVAQARYSHRPLSPWRPQDLRRQYRRELNQTRGIIENLAIRDCIRSRGYGGLPSHAATLVAGWIAEHGIPEMKLRRRLFYRAKLTRPARLVDPSLLRPHLVLSGVRAAGQGHHGAGTVGHGADAPMPRRQSTCCSARKSDRESAAKNC